MSKLLKGTLIGVGALVISTVAIQASDLVRGIESSFVGLVGEQISVCGTGATLIQLGTQNLCVDNFENSTGDTCPTESTNSPAETSANLLDTSCKPESKEGVLPWRFVSLTEAQQLCARAGKRLPTAPEWYKVSLGLTNQQDCIINENEPHKTGSRDCKTEAGIYDLVGNVWEWVDESISEGVYNGRAVPDTGFVAIVDNNGVVVQTDKQPVATYGDDYAWTNTSGVYGMIRGGFYGGEEDAGIFSQNLSVPLDLRTTGLGFRCVKDV